MCRGAIRGLAMLKFSTSVRRLGERESMVIISSEIVIVGNRSLIRKSGLNLSLSGCCREFVGEEEPFSWSIIRCVRIIREISIGRRKWREKNRFKVGLDTEGPPQIQVTRSGPRIGMAERTPVITVAPQKDICPHGST
jgi:hypothetical protein